MLDEMSDSGNAVKFMGSCFSAFKSWFECSKRGEKQESHTCRAGELGLKGNQKGISIICT